MLWARMAAKAFCRSSLAASMQLLRLKIRLDDNLLTNNDKSLIMEFNIAGRENDFSDCLLDILNSMANLAIQGTIKLYFNEPFKYL